LRLKNKKGENHIGTIGIMGVGNDNHKIRRYPDGKIQYETSEHETSGEPDNSGAKAEGKMHQVKGKIKETFGKVVGNDDLEAEGKVENLGGKVQENLGKVEKIVGE